MAALNRRRLLVDLPDEVLSLVCEELADGMTKDLSNLRLTCRRLHEICEPTSYRSIVLETTYACDDAQHSLNVRPERRCYVQSLTIVSTKNGSDHYNHRPSTPQCLSYFKNMKFLRITASLSDGNQDFGIWHATLEHQIIANSFSELQECSISVIGPDVQLPLDISSLLKACKLAKLSLKHIDLCGLDSTSSLIGHHTCLKELELDNCVLCDTTLAAILAIPSELETFAFRAQDPDEFSFFFTSDNEEELKFIQKTIDLLSVKQKKLKTLELTFNNWREYDEDLYQNPEAPDFTKLSLLKELCFRAFRNCLPLMPFANLPDCERLEISLAEPVDLLDLAVHFRKYWSNDRIKRVPTSLRRLDIFAEDQDGKYGEFRLSRDEQVRDRMKTCMEILEIPHMTYTHMTGCSLRKTFSAKRVPDSPNGEFSLESVTS